LAKSHLLKAYHIDSTYYNTCNSLGFIELTFDKKPEKAILWFNKSYKNYPSKFETTLNLAICFEKLNQTDSALAYFDKSYRLKPNSESLKLYFSNYLKTINKSDLIPKYYPF
jgi:Tfp pilus assembly protein PilF